MPFSRSGRVPERLSGLSRIADKLIDERGRRQRSLVGEDNEIKNNKVAKGFILALHFKTTVLPVIHLLSLLYPQTTFL